MQLHAIVHGRVQGVGFREWTRRTAQQFGVKGWVRNKRDGTVEVLAQADEYTLKRFEQLLHNGPNHAYVDRVDATYSDKTEAFSGFDVRW